MEWIGEMFFAMKNPETDPFPFSVVAHSAKVVCFRIHCSNLKLMPNYIKQQFISNGKMRAGHVKS